MSGHDGGPAELGIPPAARDAKRAVELLRMWAADGQQHVSIATGLWDDPASWGIALADLARHVAKAYALTATMPEEDAFERILAGLTAELEMATDEPGGRLQG